MNVIGVNISNKHQFQSIGKVYVNKKVLDTFNFEINEGIWILTSNYKLILAHIYLLSNSLDITNMMISLPIDDTIYINNKSSNITENISNDNYKLYKAHKRGIANEITIKTISKKKTIFFH